MAVQSRRGPGPEGVRGTGCDLILPRSPLPPSVFISGLLPCIGLVPRRAGLRVRAQQHLRPLGPRQGQPRGSRFEGAAERGGAGT